MKWFIILHFLVGGVDTDLVLKSQYYNSIEQCKEVGDKLMQEDALRKGVELLDFDCTLEPITQVVWI